MNKLKHKLRQVKTARNLIKLLSLKQRSIWH